MNGGKVMDNSESVESIVKDLVLQLDDIDTGLAVLLPEGDHELLNFSVTSIKENLKKIAREGRAVSASHRIEFNDSLALGARVVRDFSKLALRAYNAEFENIFREISSTNIKTKLNQLESAKKSIDRLGKPMKITISADYHRTAKEALMTRATYQTRIKAAREAAAEERKAAEALKQQREKLQKEMEGLNRALASKPGDPTLLKAIETLQGKISENQIREQNYKIGTVYVISNVGSFGEGVVKIGMTRRAEPQERIDELGDASVPFDFDIHALIETSDAPGLEAWLHRKFEKAKVNLKNERKEHFYVKPQQVRDALNEYLQSTSETWAETFHFDLDVQPVEWLESEKLRREFGDLGQSSENGM